MSIEISQTKKNREQKKKRRSSLIRKELNKSHGQTFEKLDKFYNIEKKLTMQEQNKALEPNSNNLCEYYLLNDICCGRPFAFGLRCIPFPHSAHDK